MALTGAGTRTQRRTLLVAKFQFDWTEEQWFRTTIEANDKQEAIDKFFTGDYPEYVGLEPYGYHTQEGIDIELIDKED